MWLRIVFVLVVVVLIAAGAYYYLKLPGEGRVETFRDCSDCPLMARIPAGSFAMGTTPDESARDGVEPGQASFERPRHAVSVSAFSLGVNEVTRDQFDAFVRATGYRGSGQPCQVYDVTQRKWIDNGPYDWRSPGFAQDGNHPVVCVSWSDAKAYVAWLSQRTHKTYRLPSEAEWEYAARGGTTTSGPWGNARADACRFANGPDQTARQALNWENWRDRDYLPCTDGFAQTSPTGALAANGFGLHDMIGNAWEFTEDCWHENYNGAPATGSAWAEGMYCARVTVKRGGSWASSAPEIRSAFRNGLTTTGLQSIQGFRVARSD